MPDDKYIVFKRDDYRHMTDPKPLEDAVVIRMQDIFASSALFAYASAIRTSIEILEATVSDTDPQTLERLSDIADYFMARGEEASKHPVRKVPD